MKTPIALLLLLVILAAIACEANESARREGRSRRPKPNRGRRPPKPDKKNSKERNRGRSQQPVLVPPISGQRIRLAGDRGDELRSGTIEVFMRNKWGIVCDDSWDIKDANVACRQLGFSRGAESANSSASFGQGNWNSTDILMDDVHCTGGEQSLQHCDYNYPSNCQPEEAAGVVCRANPGCPSGWIAGPTGCYINTDWVVTKRAFAVNKCAALGGHLVNIETEAEHNFLAMTYYGNFTGPVLTGAKKSRGNWMWEKVTREGAPLPAWMSRNKRAANDKRRGRGRGRGNRGRNRRPNSQSNTQGRTQITMSVENRTEESIRWFKWFPGFQPGNARAEPTNKRKELCLFLSPHFSPDGKRNVSVDYLYWMDEVCQKTKKKHAGGIKYLCEKPLEITPPRTPAEECYEDNGMTYRGTKANTEKGTPCIRWEDGPAFNPTTHPEMDLDNNYCRNPDNDSRPWCWVGPGEEFGFCPIPQCSEDASPPLPPTPTPANPGQSAHQECPDDQFYCRTGHSCISRQWYCDGEPDCPEEEDEPVTLCDYKLKRFRKYPERKLENHMIKETFMGVSNETCAKLCVSREAYVCRSFSFRLAERRCVLSEGNVQTHGMPPPAPGYSFFELTSQTTNCTGMFRCTNGRCIGEDLQCNRADDCGDSSDEQDCGGAEEEEIEVRLVEGGEHSGRVEVKYLGEWGVVCDDNWEDVDATVVCRMLGYTRGTPKASGHSTFGSGNAKFFLDEVACDGTEGSLSQCSHNGWKVHDCRSHEVAGVNCDFEKACDADDFRCETGECMPATTVCDNSCLCPQCEDDGGADTSVCRSVTLELVNGTVENSGRIELVRNGLRGTVCDDSFDDVDAKVVCRMLGFRYGKAASFGAGSGPIWLDDVECTGSERYVTDCESSSWAVSNCVHSEDAGVICSNTPNEGHVDRVRPIRVELVEGGTPNRGRVEIIRNGTRGTVCDDDWDDNDATVVCRMLGYSMGKARTEGFFGPGDAASVIWLDDVACTGQETSLNDCNKPNWGTHNCAHGEDAGVVCLDNSGGGGSDGEGSGGHGSFPWVECGRRPMEANSRVKRQEDMEFEEREIATAPKFERIVGGFTAARGFYPWQVGVRRFVQDGVYSHWCGGTILSEFWILSAAHCYSELGKDSILVRTGDHDNKALDDYEQEFELELLKPHPSYDADTYDFDMALIKIKPKNGRGITFGDHVQPACLPEANTPYTVGQKCHVSGWGKTEHGYQKLLKSAKVPIIDDSDCDRLYKDITRNMVCAGYLAGGIDTCSGDSGGPLVCEINGKYTVMGATSYGAGCAEPNAPGVYARVTELLPWIKSIINRYS